MVPPGLGCSCAAVVPLAPAVAAAWVAPWALLDDEVLVLLLLPPHAARTAEAAVMPADAPRKRLRTMAGRDRRTLFQRSDTATTLL